MEFGHQVVWKVTSTVDSKALIFDILEGLVTRFGRKIALLMPGPVVKAIDFGTHPSALGSLSPTPWKHAWTSQNRIWYHLNKSSMECLEVDESSLPVYRDGGAVYPGTWLVEEREDVAVVGANALGGNHPQLGVRSISGFHLYYLRGTGLELLNQVAIPYLIWSVWREQNFLVLAGMTHRSSDDLSDQFDEEVSLGRPALIRCDLTGNRWEEISLTGTPVSDAGVFGARFRELGLGYNLQFEAWVGSEYALGHGRILLAALARKSTALLDDLDRISVLPIGTDYTALAIVSRERNEVIYAESSTRLISTVYTPERTLFIICRRLQEDGQIVGNLHIFDPVLHGLSFQKIHVEGLDPLTTFTSFVAAYFENECFFGTVTRAAETVFVHSQDGINWTVSGLSSEVECKRLSDFNEIDFPPHI